MDGRIIAQFGFGLIGGADGLLLFCADVVDSPFLWRRLDLSTVWQQQQHPDIYGVTAAIAQTSVRLSTKNNVNGISRTLRVWAVGTAGAGTAAG